MFSTNNNIEIISNCGNVAIETEKITLTYSELLSRIQRKAAYFSQFINKGEIVPILSENSIEFVVTIFALWKIRSIPSPINIMLSEAEINELLEIVKANKVIVSENLKNKISNYSTIEIEGEFPIKKSSTSIEIDKDSDALILFTSGSTSKPKAVLFTFRNLLANAEDISKIFTSLENDSWLASLPFYHIGGFAIIFRSIFSYSKIIIPESLHFESIVKSIEKFHPSFFSVVQTTLKRLLENDVKPYSELCAIFAGGGPIGTKTMRTAIKKGFPVYKVYGSTETTSMVTILSPEDFEQKPEAAGKPFSGINLTLTNENEIIIGGEQIAKGYFNNPEETSKKFRDEKFYTGDLGRIDDDGFLFITGRKEDFIISGGENVNLQKVKKVFLSLDFIEDAETFALPNSEWGEKLCVALVLKEKTGKEAIKSMVSRHLGKFEIPKEIFVVNHIPRNHLGKIKKSELLNLINRNF